MRIQEWLSTTALRAEGDANLGDKRRTNRLIGALVDIAMAPSESFPRIFPDKAALEGFYRLVENKGVSWRKISSAHSERTLTRCGEVGAVLALHDTTDITSSCTTLRSRARTCPGYR